MTDRTFASAAGTRDELTLLKRFPLRTIVRSRLSNAQGRIMETYVARHRPMTKRRAKYWATLTRDKPILRKR